MKADFREGWLSFFCGSTSFLSLPSLSGRHGDRAGVSSFSLDENRHTDMLFFFLLGLGWISE